MVDKIVKRRKVSISEDDMSTLLRRYTATTVLALLCEVAHCSDMNIDWEALAKNTSTGISDAREYQMLWRHLAYHHALLDKFEDGAQPLDDDSDLECEVEAVPVVSTDALTEAAACVKVLITSALPSDSSLPNSSLVEAPLTINIPNGPSSRAPSEIPEATCSMQGMNITIPFSVQKQPLSAATPAEGLDANVSANGTLPSRRKRKPWSETEDMELISAVQKFGEGNWANIVRADFMVDRTAAQLSQRWAIIRKRRGNLNIGINSTSSQLSEARRAAHHAMSLALDMPVKNFTAARPVHSNGFLHWDVGFTRAVQDWELDEVTDFFPCGLGGIERDKLTWKHTGCRKFLVRSYYKVLTVQHCSPFPWKTIWRSHVPSKVAFFIWTASLGNILTIDTLRKWGFVIMELCFMCKKHGESVDHLLLHCVVSKALWDGVFGRVGLVWVMLMKVVDLLACWMGLRRSKQVAAAWKIVPLCLM